MSDEKFFENLAKGNGHERRYKVEENGKNLEEKMELTKTDAAETEGKLTIDVYQTPTEIVVESAVAGVKPEDIDVDVSGDSVTIRGERRHEEKVSDDNYFYQECYWGRFSRSVILPEEINPDGAKVNFRNGILTVRLPKSNRKKAKKLKVETE